MTNIFSVLILFVFCVSINVTSSSYTAEDCKTLGFNKAQLLCSTCDKMKDYELNHLREHCLECCIKDSEGLGTRRFPKAVLEVCTCKFGAYPQIQAFIKSDRPAKFKNLEIKYIRGYDPVIKLLDADKKVEDVLDIHKWDTDSVEEFLMTHLALD